MDSGDVGVLLGVMVLLAPLVVAARIGWELMEALVRGWISKVKDLLFPQWMRKK